MTTIEECRELIARIQPRQDAQDLVNQLLCDVPDERTQECREEFEQSYRELENACELLDDVEATGQRHWWRRGSLNRNSVESLCATIYSTVRDIRWKLSVLWQDVENLRKCYDRDEISKKLDRMRRMLLWYELDIERCSPYLDMDRQTHEELSQRVSHLCYRCEHEDYDSRWEEIVEASEALDEQLDYLREYIGAACAILVLHHRESWSVLRDVRQAFVNVSEQTGRIRLSETSYEVVCQKVAERLQALSMNGSLTVDDYIDQLNTAIREPMEEFFGHAHVPCPCDVQNYAAVVADRLIGQWIDGSQ